MNRDIEVYSIVQWRLLRYFAPSRLNSDLLNDGVNLHEVLTWQDEKGIVGRSSRLSDFRNLDAKHPPFTYMYVYISRT